MKRKKKQRPGERPSGTLDASEPLLIEGDDEGDRAGEVHVMLFDAEGDDRQVDTAEIDIGALSERQLLWVDCRGRPPEELLNALGLDVAISAVKEGNGKPRLQNFGDWFLLRVIAIQRPEPLRFCGSVLTILVGRNFVVSLHREPLEYFEQLRDRERGDTRIGALDAESFTASLLDWQMTTYFDAVAQLEEAVDRLEVQLLTQPVLREHVPELAVLRRAASRLRRLLAPHRTVYGVMARPDFRPEDQEDVQKQFRALNERFERALDTVEAARELVIGSFELFSTRMAQRTNDTMRVLTFVTVLLGTLAVVAGVLGMNFDAEIFRTGTRGLVVSLVVMVVFAVAALVTGKRRGWW